MQGDCVLFSSVGFWEGFLGVRITQSTYLQISLTDSSSSSSFWQLDSVLWRTAGLLDATSAFYVLSGSEIDRDCVLLTR